MTQFTLTEDYIRLDDLLKLTGRVEPADRPSD